MSRVRRIATARSWKSFGFEVAIIVVGVLLALGAEQLISNWRWQNEISATREKLALDVFASLNNGQEMVSLASCEEQQLGRLREALAVTNGRWRPVTPWRDDTPVYSSPVRVYPTAQWEAAQNSGVLTRMDDYALATYTVQFAAARAADDLQWRAQPLTAQLQVLDRERPLSDDQALRLAIIVEELDEIRRVRVLIGNQMLDNAVEAFPEGLELSDEVLAAAQEEVGRGDLSQQRQAKELECLDLDTARIRQVVGLPHENARTPIDEPSDAAP